MKKLFLIPVFAAALLSGGCGHRNYYQQNAWNQPQADPCMQSANPAECDQVVMAGGSPYDYMQYGMNGMMFSQMATPYGMRPYLVPNPYYHGVRYPVASYSRSRTYVTTTRTIAPATSYRAPAGSTTRVVTSSVGSATSGPRWSTPTKATSSSGVVSSFGGYGGVSRTVSSGSGSGASSSRSSGWSGSSSSGGWSSRSSGFSSGSSGFSRRR